MAKKWRPNYPKEYQQKLHISHASLGEYIQEQCRAHTTQPAFWQMQHALTYRELGEKSSDLAAFLQQKLQLAAGTRIAIMLPNCLQYPIAASAILQAGYICVNVNPLSTARELLIQLQDADVSAIIVLNHFAHTVQAVFPELLSLQHVIVTQIADEIPGWRGRLINAISRFYPKRLTKWKMPYAWRWNNVIRQGQQQSLQTVKIGRDDLAFLQYTGGTGGELKAAMLTHGNLLANIQQSLMCFNLVKDFKHPFILSVLPFYHIFGLTVNFLCALGLGAESIVVINPRDLKNLVKTWQQYPISLVPGVNTLFNALLHYPAFKKINFKDLKLCVAGGMALQPAVEEAWQEVTGIAIHEGYGLSETSPVAALNPLHLPPRRGSIGVPVPGTDIEIRDSKQERLPDDSIGEVMIRGPQVMLGYWRKPEITRVALDAKGWFATGDLGYVDDEGRIHLVDRKKDMILVSGFNVYPNEVEAVLTQHPAIVEAGVIGVPDEYSGEHVKAYVVTRDKGLSRDDIINFAKQNLTPYKVPKDIEFCTELPKTTVGKVLRRALR